MKRYLLSLAILLMATGLSAETFNAQASMPGMNEGERKSVLEEVAVARMRADREMNAPSAPLPPAPANLVTTETRVPMPSIAAPAMPVTNGLQPIKPTYRPN